MSTPMEENGGAQERTLAARLTSPRAVFIALLITLVVVVLLTPQPQDERVRVLDSRSSEAGGARMLHDLAARSGWPVRRRSGDVAGVPDSSVVHLVLEPARSIAATEIHALLELVRGGAGLVVVAPTSELRDSLWQAVGARNVEGSGYLSTGFETEAESCPAPLRQHGILTWPGDRVLTYALELTPSSEPAEVFATAERSAEVLRLEREAVAAEVGNDSSTADSLRRQAARVPALRGERALQPAVAGFRLGEGRIVYLADADLLRNDVLRYCAWGADVLAVRILEWVSAGERPSLVFDESHRPVNFGSWYTRIGRWIANTADGRAAVMLSLAAAALILALGRRPLPPVTQRRLERRSPLEHVDALARAYSQARATRTSARRLVRGLRRRHAGLSRSEDDESFLRRVADRHPSLRDDVEMLLRASRERIPSSDLGRLLEAVDSVDNTLAPS